jgi:hypothetical protein
MIIVRDLFGELGIIMNFNDHMVTWDTDTIPMKTEVQDFNILRLFQWKTEMHVLDH